MRQREAVRYLRRACRDAANTTMAIRQSGLMLRTTLALETLRSALLAAATTFPSPLLNLIVTEPIWGTPGNGSGTGIFSESRKPRLIRSAAPRTPRAGAIANPTARCSAATRACAADAKRGER